MNSIFPLSMVYLFYYSYQIYVCVFKNNIVSLPDAVKFRTQLCLIFFFLVLLLLLFYFSETFRTLSILWTCQAWPYPARDLQMTVKGGPGTRFWPTGVLVSVGKAAEWRCAAWTGCAEWTQLHDKLDRNEHSHVAAARAIWLILLTVAVRFKI